MESILEKLEPGVPSFNMETAILSAPVRHSFMMGIVWYLTKKAKNPDLHILEIGSWYGASALSWAQGLKLHNDCKGVITCVDAWETFFDMNEHTDDLYQKMQESLKIEAAYRIFQHNIKTVPESILCQHLRGKSDDLLPLLRNDYFDIVFIDADHTYEPVKADIKNSIRLVKDGGIICGDDLNLFLHQCDEKNARDNAHKDFIQDPKTGRNFHPGVTLAVAEIFGEVSSWGGFWAIQKDGDGWKKVSLKGMPIDFPDHFPEKALEDAKGHMADIDIY